MAKTLIKIIDYILNTFYKEKKHWYEVKFIYKRKSNMTIIFDFNSQVGLKNQSTILNSREVKKILKPLHKYTEIGKKTKLQNGILSIEIISYLGHFKKL